MQFTLTFTDTADNKNIEMQIKRTDDGKDTDHELSPAAHMVSAVLEMLDGVDHSQEIHPVQ